MRVNYRKFIETYFYLVTKKGEVIPFILNEVQAAYYQTLITDYPTMQGVRETILKGRQFGISTFIEAIFAVDFILSSLGRIPRIDSDIYTHKDKETASHFARVNAFINCWLLKDQGGDYAVQSHHKHIDRLRKNFLDIDKDSGLLVSKNGTRLETGTAGSKVSGRGSTRGNILWSEAAFYPNTPIISAENLIIGAEEQVPTDYGKIFRESTGNLAADYYALEYKLGKEQDSEFKSRFMVWYSHPEYTKPAPTDWAAPAYYDRLLAENLADINQCYWHFRKTRGLTNKKRMREYPTYDTEAFLYGGEPFFDADSLLHYTNGIRKPQKEVMYASAL